MSAKAFCTECHHQREIKNIFPIQLSGKFECFARDNKKENGKRFSINYPHHRRFLQLNFLHFN